jgi:L-threonylcarbamoyladenylate synthase
MKISEFKKNFRELVAAIKTGKIIICPTDTVYGLLCDATNKQAVEKIFKIKKRKKGKPLPIFVKDLKMAKRLAFINAKQEKILKEAWPGKVTVVLKRNRKVKIYGVDRKTVALRIPNYKIVNFLLDNLRKPLSGTSANLSGSPASTKIKEVIKQFKDEKYQPDLVVDAGNLPKSLPSTIIDLTGREIKIIRKGSVKISDF